MLLYSVYAGFSISALLSYYGDLMKVCILVGDAYETFRVADVTHMLET